MKIIGPVIAAWKDSMSNKVLFSIMAVTTIAVIAAETEGFSCMDMEEMPPVTATCYGCA